MYTQYAQSEQHGMSAAYRAGKCKKWYAGVQYHSYRFWHKKLFWSQTDKIMFCTLLNKKSFLSGIQSTVRQLTDSTATISS